MYPIFGNVPLGDNLPIFFATYSGSTGASITMTGLAVTDIEVYKDGSATQRASDAGFVLLDTDGTDFDANTGIHAFGVNTGDNTDAGFYEVGPWYTVVVNAVTVDGQTVNFIAAMFRLVAAETVVGKPEVVLASVMKKNTALNAFHFLMTDDTNHNPVAGKTVTVTRAIDGGSFGAGTIGSVTEVANGVYRVDLPAADRNGNVVTYRFTASGADDLFITHLLEP